MYVLTLDNPEESIIRSASRLLSNPAMLRLAMSSVSRDWKHSAEVNLTNPHRNQRAWIGQSACCLITGANEDLTKSAWHRLSVAEQDEANRVADVVIRTWREHHA
jgi:hypothetical protein